MGESKRWSVMYTKHVRQKRKVYQDGYLELQSSGNKVILYDEHDKLLESRFVKKDDAIKSGETLTFDAYLVDIVNHCGENKPISSLNSQDNHMKIKEEFGPSHNNESPKMKPSFVKNKAQVTKFSPSQKIIREFKKNELNKYSSSSSPGCLGIAKSIKTGWQVLYTTQITQKAKKFHDGFLQLIVSGSQGRQVILYDDARRHLDSRFLKKSEVVDSGESLAFEGHLVDIGELERDHKSPINLNLEGKIQHSTSWGIHTDFGGSIIEVDERKLSLGMPTYEPRRAAQEILSILKKPMIGEGFVAQNKKLVEEHLDSHSADVNCDIKHHINKYVQSMHGCVEDDLNERVVADDCMFKVFKSEAVEILNDSESCTVSENDRESDARSSPVCLSRSGVGNYTIPTVNDCGVYHIELVPTSVPLSSTSLIKSDKNVELENPLQISSCKEPASETTATSANDLSFNVSPKFSNDGVSCDPLDDVERTLKQDFNRKETDEFPTFDLGL